LEGGRKMGEIDLKSFEKKIVVRAIRLTDHESIVQLQLKCFPGMKPWTREQLESQLSIFPEGQICLEYEGRVVASSSSLILDFDEYAEWHSWREIADRGFIRNHDPDGETLYGIEIMVDPEFRGLRLARRLYDARKRLAQERNLRRIILGGRIPGYGKYADQMSAREYVDKVINKALVDPVLTTQLSNGFVLKRLIPNYLTSDTESRGYATFLEWTNLDYAPEPGRRLIVVSPVRVCAVQYQMRMVENFEAFAGECEYFVDVASDYKCDFILFPEMLTTQLLTFLKAERPGLAVRKLSDYTPRYLELFTRLAIKHNINIIGGTHLTVEEDDLYNVAYLFRRDGTLGKQYKLHITSDERRWWGVKPGSKMEVFETDMGKVAIQICHDIEFPELTRTAVENGAEIIFVPFSADERYDYLRVRYCAQARCIENSVYAVIAGGVGNLPSVEHLDIHYAQSGIFTPSDIPFSRDAIAAECPPNIETVVFEELDLELLKKHRQSGGIFALRDQRMDLNEVSPNKPS
jgi:predicted amidohydrolase/ribosomal protein S18 acetylase RimI-like enzyme